MTLPGRLLSVVLLSLIAVTFSRAGEPVLEWSFETRGKIYASPILADLDSDGRPEVVVCASRDKRVLCLNGQGEVLWEYAIHDQGSDGIQATPSAVDYDGDGKKEVFFVDTGGVAGCLDYRGNLIWRSFTGDRTDYSGPVLADLDGDHHIEIVFGSESGTLYCLDDCGQPRWRYQGDGGIRGIPAVTCHEPSRSMRVYVTFAGGVDACVDSEGRVVWSHQEPAPARQRRSGPAVGDLDGDGAPEVVSATEDFHVIVRNAFTGEEKWRWKGRAQLDQTGSFALADFDGSGRLDIVCGDGTGLGGPGHVYRLREGKALWTADMDGGIVQGPSAGDVDGDGDLEILACLRSGRLVCLSSAGQEEWSFRTQAGTLTTPALGDIDGDGLTEIVLTSKDRFVYCVSVSGAHRPERMPWPMMNHDAQLSGNVNGATFNPEAPQVPPARKPDLMIEQFGPLRVGSNTVAFTFTNNAPRPRHLEAVAEIARPETGAFTHTVSMRCMPFEDKSHRLDLPAVSEGEYRLLLRLVDIGTGKTIATREAGETLRPFAFEEHTADTLKKAGRRLAAGLKDTQAKQRGLRALQNAFETTQTQLAEARKAPATAHARLEVAGNVRKALREMERVVARLRAACATPSRALDFAVVADTTMKKVFRDEPYLEEGAVPMMEPLSLAQNELEGIQVVVVPLWKDLRRLRVSVGSLQQRGGTGHIPSEDVQLRSVGYVEIGPPEYNWFVEKQGWYPDVLFPYRSLDVPADQDAQPFFVTLKARENTPAGDYEGIIKIEADECAAIELPLQVQVWDFAIPKEPRLPVSMWMGENWIRQFYEYDETPDEVRRAFYDLHLQHRISPIRAFSSAPRAIEDLEYTMSRGQNVLFVDVPRYTAEKNRAAIAEQLRATRDLLAAKSWADRTLLYSYDEVAVMARHLIPEVVEMNQWVKTVVPEWPRLETSAPEQSLFGAVDIWCPTIYHFSPTVLRERMAAGDRLWFYTVWGRPGLMIEFPGTDHRLMFWACWKYGAEGFLYWGTTHWDLNTQGDKRWPDAPWKPYNRQPGHNGCGYLIYPGPNGSPLSSIRLELVRDGIEDYEYLHTLQDLVKAAGPRAPKEVLDKALAELAVDPSVLADHKTFTENPGVLLATRRRIARLIEQLRPWVVQP